MSESDPKTITKRELIERISSRTGHTKVMVKDVLQFLLDEITEELARGRRIEFREFGVFEVKERAARRAQNPKTMELIQVPKRRIVRFKIGGMLRKRVCAGEARDGNDAELELVEPEEQAPPPPAPKAPPKRPHTPPSNSPF